MLHVLLLIVKIIGILLFSIMGLIILVLGILLFIPIRYKVVGEYGESKCLMARVNWLFHILSMCVIVDKSKPDLFNFTWKIFGITLVGTDKKKQKKKRKKKRKKKNKKKNTESLLELQAEMVNPPIQKLNVVTKDKIEEKPVQKQHKPVIERILFFFKSLAFQIKNWKYTIKKICDRIKEWRELLDQDETKASISLCKKQLIYIWKQLKFQKFLCHIDFGMDDPSVTGQILAIYGMLYPAIGNNIQVQADFERVFLEGHLYIKGKIRIFTFVKVALVVYFNKNIKKLLKSLKREEI